MLRRYPDAEATMGEARLVGETGPDEAGSTLAPTTVKVSFNSHCLRCFQQGEYVLFQYLSVPIII